MKLLHTILFLLTRFTTHSQTAQITGIVRDVKDQPIIGAHVLLATDSARIDATITGPNGEYRIANLYPNKYNLTVRHSGYPDHTITHIMVGHENVTQNLILQMPLRGTVTTTWGRPVKGAKVALSTWFTDTALTQPDGSYVIHPHRMHGEHKITASRKGYASSRTTITFNRKEDCMVNFTLRRKWWKSKK